MGLSVEAKGLEDTYECGYITFMQFRKELAKAYDEKVGELYGKLIDEGLDNDELAWLNKNCPKGLICFLAHSDCDGKFTPKQCKMVYDAIKDLKMDMIGRNYGSEETYNLLERWKDMFRHCYKRRVNMYFY